MKAITFRDARGVKKTVKHSLLKIAWRWVVRFLTTGLMLVPIMSQGASSPSYSIQGLREVAEARAGIAVDLAAGRKNGFSAIHKFGANPDCSTTEEDVWAQGGDYQFQTSTSVVRIRAGGNAADTAGGLGAQSIRIEGLDINFNFQTNLLVTNGASASDVSTGAFIRVNRAYVVDIGTTATSATAGGNVGAIIVESTATGHAVISILAGKGQSQAAVYTIPANKTGWLESISMNVSGNKPTSVYIYRRENADDFTSPYSSRRVIDGFDELQGFADHPYPIPVILRAKTDVWFTCKTLSGASVTSVDFDIILEDN